MLNHWEIMGRPIKKTGTKYCEHCGTEFQRTDYNGRLQDVKIFHQRKYCSLTCANSRKHPKHWTTYHLRAKKFKKAYCEACGHNKSLQAHHIDQDIKNNTIENIQTLCKHCHDFWHATQKRRGLYIAGKMPALFCQDGKMDGKAE
jgi:hypothetical protein